MSPTTGTMLIGCLLPALLLGCAPDIQSPADGVPLAETELYDEAPGNGPSWFEDVTDKVGLNFVHDAGPTGSYFLPQSMGSGAAFLDFDGDGRLDVYLIQNGGPNSHSVNRLFHQEPDGTFKDVTEKSGLGIAGYGMGVAVGDVNNDGLTDVLVTEFGRLRLFLNRGDGRFEDVTTEAGLESSLWGTSAAFLDYDRDGRLDIIIANYVDYPPNSSCAQRPGMKDFCSPNALAHTSAKLFRNTGPRPGGERPAARVTFRDETVSSGLGALIAPGLGVAVADFDGDGWPDVFVANDARPNRLWINCRNGTFSDEAVARGVATTGTGRAMAGMGVAVGDIANVGRLDVFVTHLTSETNTLWRQRARGQFVDVTAEWGLLHTRRGTGFGTVCADLDNDGFLDLAIVNGRVTRGSPRAVDGVPEFWAPYAERNQLLANTGSGRFIDISGRNAPLCGHRNVARGLVAGDFDNDGALDLLVTTIAGRARLYRNVAPNRGHWLKVRAIDPNLNRDAYGAEVTVVADNRTFFRVLSPAESYLCSAPSVLHFGLGTADRITRIEVKWPDGWREEFDGPTSDTTVKLLRGTGRASRRSE